jgi:prepilin-type processing-associated H-X9-DG protein/prepilin-type N-terminal cleavage/methylation domain-containing protein
MILRSVKEMGEFDISLNTSRKRAARWMNIGEYRLAFTLVELLTAISILALLMGILLPVLARTRAAAKSVLCQNNLRQWGMALHCYIEAYDGSIPRRGQGIQPVSKIERTEDWFNCLAPYAGEKPYKELVAAGSRPRPGDDSLFVCPNALCETKPYFFPYAMNMYLSPWIRPQAHRLCEIPQPQRLVFMADAPGPYSSTVPSKEDYSVAARHKGKANLVFLDGRVGSYSGEYLGCGISDPGHEDVQWQTGSKGVNQARIN